MNVDESRQHGGFAKIDFTRAGGDRKVWANSLNALAANQNVLVLEHAAGMRVE